MEPVLLYGILPFGIKISDERVNNHKNLFAVSFGHFRNFLHAAECMLVELQIRIPHQIISAELKQQKERQLVWKGKNTDGKNSGFRVEYDEKNGAHINVFSGKEKGPHFTFPATEKTVSKIQKKYEKD